MSTVLVVAPHPDDETLGCGGTLLRHIENGDLVHWLILTDMSVEYGYPESAVRDRSEEIQKVGAAYGFSSVHNLKLPPTKLDMVSRTELTQRIGRVITETAPTDIYLTFRGDIHSDHAAAFDAVAACTKWFRYPSIRRVACYETLSETDFGLNPEGVKFVPNVFVDISDHMNRKVEIARMYVGEMKAFPFPRSEEALRALAQVRGAASGCQAAEGFMLLREILR